MQDADTIEVGLFGDERKRYRAVRVGSDPLTDTALIRLVSPPAELPTVTVGDSGALEPGDCADEARELELPERAGAIVMTVYPDSAAARAGLRAGDVVVGLDGRKVADTRALMAIGSSLAPGTETTVRIFRNGREQTARITIEEMPVERDDRVSRTPPDDNEGLTLGDVGRSRTAHSSLASDPDGALVVNVVAGSAADEAELVAGDIIRAINRRPVHGAADARRRLRSLEAGRPIFLLVWRSGTEMFLRMRRQ